ncbi:NACHT domain-containing protein [Mycena venus]|uniref:NACHT domain-containing protein n=1 Tax=Mycena venus TaxID=2733690 RepID=A0A8H6Z1W7_9AGAR|nr:NACHT domain-containing protein [Mycena venus]
MPVISSSSGNKDGTSDDVEEMKARRTPEHMKGHRSDPLEPASTQMSDWHFLDTNEYEPVTMSPDVPPTRRPKLLGRLLRFGNQSQSTSTSASQFLGRILGGSREGSAVPAGPTSSPPALSKTSSSPRSSHSDPPPTIVPRIPFDDGYTSEDAVVGGSEMHSETRIIKYTSTTDLEGSSTDHLAPGPSNFQVTAKRPAFQPEQKTSIVVHNQFYGGTGGTGGSGLRGRGGDGGVGEGPTVNYHMEAGANLNHIQRDGEPGLHILYRASAGDATHDSEDRFPQPRCHPETRTKLLDVLLNWAKGIEPSNWKFDHDEGEDGSSSSEYTSPDKLFSPILWLHGPAGAGKSAVAQSLCQILEEEGRLGASFFFKRGHPSRGHAKRLFVTIAYQLACHLPDLNRHISQNVENNPSLVDKSLSIQIQKLIVEPCRKTSSTVTPAVVIVLDGLDECDDRNIQQEILRLLGYAVHEQQLPLRFLVASRPEPHICEMFSGTLNGIHRPVNVEQSFEDVRKYLLDEFTRVHQEHHETMAMVPLPWPPAETVENLVDKSSGYFIYASTVIRFIDDKDFRPTERLQVITGIQESHPESGLPFAALDALYIQILCVVPRRPHLFKILAVIATMHRILPMSYIDQLLELQPGEVQLVLRGLQSVIGTKKGGTECNDWSIQSYIQSDIVVHHASFLDFLQDPERAGIFYVGSSLQTELSRHILKALSYSYDNPSLNRHGFVGQ